MLFRDGIHEHNYYVYLQADRVSENDLERKALFYLLALTEETRRDLAKKAHKVAEEFKVRIRNERRDANDDLKKMEKNGEITEDELKKAQEEVQKITDKFIKEIDTVAAGKEKDIMEV